MTSTPVSLRKPVRLVKRVPTGHVLTQTDVERLRSRQRSALTVRTYGAMVTERRQAAEPFPAGVYPAPHVVVVRRSPVRALALFGAAVVALMAALVGSPAEAGAPDLNKTPFPASKIQRMSAGSTLRMACGDRNQYRASDLGAYTVMNKALRQRSTAGGYHWRGQGGDVRWSRSRSVFTNDTDTTVKVAVWCE